MASCQEGIFIFVFKTAPVFLGNENACFPMFCWYPGFFADFVLLVETDPQGLGP